MNITRKQAKQLRAALPDMDSRIEPGTVCIRQDGSVEAIMDPMANTNQRGRVFVGWDTELIDQIER